MKFSCKKCGHRFYFDDAVYLAAEYSHVNWRCPRCQNIVLTEKTRMTPP
jgi:predicted nucleic-acid-binding Zn-ribbon protein